MGFQNREGLIQLLDFSGITAPVWVRTHHEFSEALLDGSELPR